MTEQLLATFLKKYHMTLTTAESCTGGLLAKRITDVSGASSVLEISFVTYANEAKEKILSVKHETLEMFGAVSEQTAYEMALGACKASGAEVGLAVTGIAGPDGGTEQKPVGTVFIACCLNGIVTVKKYILKKPRKKVL